jgi:hypothetical protein
MFETREPKSRKMYIERPSHQEAWAHVRKAPVRSGQRHKDKANDYTRKPKHFRGWED